MISIASALAIGSRSAVGREGPIIQMVPRSVRLWARSFQCKLVSGYFGSAGAGARIAATFNTPIGGVLFATQLMLPEIIVNTLLPVAVATGAATFIGRLFFGSRPACTVPTDLAGYRMSPVA